jgi:hypothetical protein
VLLRPSTHFSRHPIRSIKEKIGSAIEDLVITAPEVVKDTAGTVTDKINDVNNNLLEPVEQQLADEHGYTHGGKRERLVKHIIGVSKYEDGTHFLSKHAVNPTRKDYGKTDSSGKKLKHKYLLYVTIHKKMNCRFDCFSFVKIDE